MRRASGSLAQEGGGIGVEEPRGAAGCPACRCCGSPSAGQREVMGRQLVELVFDVQAGQLLDDLLLGQAAGVRRQRRNAKGRDRKTRQRRDDRARQRARATRREGFSLAQRRLQSLQYRAQETVRVEGNESGLQGGP